MIIFNQRSLRFWQCKWYTAKLSCALGHSAGIFFTDKLTHMQLYTFIRHILTERTQIHTCCLSCSTSRRWHPTCFAQLQFFCFKYTKSQLTQSCLKCREFQNDFNPYDARREGQTYPMLLPQSSSKLEGY